MQQNETKVGELVGKARNAYYGKAGALASVLMLSPLAAMASGGSDPSTEIVASINQGKVYGIAAATAFVVAVWAITAIYMAKRKG